MKAFYNEIDKYAAQWLRNLMEAGEITPGVVDERSIEDVTPGELLRYDRCHFFAGIGGWDYALRLAGWPAGVPVWTGSCPCQPFSTAGKRGGGTDERHLWPAWYWLIRECRPAIIFGEQVASKDGLRWLDVVFADLEAAGYSCGAADLCAAGVGAPHIRQRLWFVANTESQYRRNITQNNSNGDRWQGRNESYASGSFDSGPSPACELADTEENRCGRESQRAKEVSGIEGLCPACELADAELCGCKRIQKQSSTVILGEVDVSPCSFESVGAHRPGSDNPWHSPLWLPCRDGKARPTEPGLQPLAYGIQARVGRLRAYGNAIVPQVAAEFIKAVMDVLTTAQAPEWGE